MSLYIVKAKKTKLKANLSASASQVTLDELVDSQGNAIVTASFGEWFVLVVKQGDQIEMIKCTTVTQNANGSATITVATSGRNLLPIFPYVGTPTGYSFLSGAEVIVTNDPLTVMSFANKQNDEFIEGLWEFAQTPIGLNAGAVNDASTTAKGIGRASADPTISLGTVTMTIASPAVFTKNSHGLTANDMVKFTTTISLPTGIVAGTIYYVMSTGLTANDFQLSASQGGVAINTSGSQSGVHTLYKATPVFATTTDYRVGSNSYGVDSGTANAHVVTLSGSSPTSYIGGDSFSYKVNVTNTTVTTVNIAGLGVKTIKKLDGVTNLVAGDLVAGMIIEIEYNETSGFFMLKTPVANAPYVGTPPNLAVSDFICGETLAVGDKVAAYFYQSDGGVTLDAKTVTSSNSTASLSTTITVASQSNRTAIVVVKHATGSGYTSTGVTFDGVAMTQLVNNQLTTTQHYVSVYRLVSPNVGATRTVTNTFNGTVSDASMFIYVYYNTDITTPGTSYGVGTTGSNSLTTAVPINGALLLSMFAGAGGALTGNDLSNTQSASPSSNHFMGDSGIIPNTINCTTTCSAAGTLEYAYIYLKPLTAPVFGYAKKTSASSTTNAVQANLYDNFLGVVTAVAGGGVLGQVATIQTDGVVTGLSGLQPLATQYLSDTASTLSATAGTNSKKVGRALSATTLLIKHDN